MIDSAVIAERSATIRYEEKEFPAMLRYYALLLLMTVTSQVRSAEFDPYPSEIRDARVTSRFEMYNPKSEAQLETLHSLGFTQVILDWLHLHEAATSLGLDVVLAHWWTNETTDEAIAKAMEYARRVDPARLAGISMMDEPERYAADTPFAFYQALYFDLRDELDQDGRATRLEISHWGPLPSWPATRYEEFVSLYHAADRIRLMPYPDLDEGPLSEVFYQVARSRQLMQLADREIPQVVILQTWVLPEEPKLPTIDELRVMAYTAMLAGADTLSFYNYDLEVWRREPGFESAFHDLMRELVNFSRQFKNATSDSTMSDDGILTSTLSPSDGEPIQVVINTNRESVGGMPPLTVRLPIDDVGVVTDSNDQIDSFSPTPARVEGRPRLKCFRSRATRRYSRRGIAP